MFGEKLPSGLCRVLQSMAAVVICPHMCHRNRTPSMTSLFSDLRQGRLEYKLLRLPLACHHASLKLPEGSRHLRSRVARLARPKTLSFPSPTPPRSRIEGVLMDSWYAVRGYGFGLGDQASNTTSGSLAEIFAQDGWDFHDMMADKRRQISLL